LEVEEAFSLKPIINPPAAGFRLEALALDYDDLA